jgi:hypothetical protein
MNRKLKEKFTEWPTSLYNLDWVVKTATKRYKEFLRLFNNSLPEDKRIKDDNNRFALIYYAAFEDALNACIEQVMKDGITSIDLYLNELGKLTATMKDKS